MKKLGLTIVALLLSGFVHAAVLKIATVAPEGSGWMKEMRASAKEIQERTDGRVQIKYYGGGVMGNDTKVLGKIRIGNLHGGAFASTRRLLMALKRPGLSVLVSRLGDLRSSCRMSRSEVSANSKAKRSGFLKEI